MAMRIGGTTSQKRVSRGRTDSASKVSAAWQIMMGSDYVVCWAEGQGMTPISQCGTDSCQDASNCGDECLAERFALLGERFGEEGC